MPIDLRRLEVFLAVVEEGGFTRAADALNISQPAVSQAIRELEFELDTPVFLRIGRRVTLTSAGEVLVLTARQLRRDLDVGLAKVHEVVGAEAGRLDLACLPTLAIAPLAPLIGLFRVRHPNVTFSLLAPEDTDELLNFVRSGRSELAITEEVDAPDLVSRRLGRQDYLIVLPPGTSVPQHLDVKDLALLPFVAPPVGTSTRRLLDDVCSAAGVVPNVVVDVSQREALLPLIVAGAGVGLLPQPLAEVAAQLGCVVVAPMPRVERVVALVHRRGPLTPAAERFIALGEGHGALPRSYTPNVRRTST